MRRAHRHTGCRSETHARVHGFAMVHSRQARTVAEMSEYHPALRGVNSGQAGQLFHQERIRQPVKPVPPHALRFVAAGDRQQAGHARRSWWKAVSKQATCGRSGKRR